MRWIVFVAPGWEITLANRISEDGGEHLPDFFDRVAVHAASIGGILEQRRNDGDSEITERIFPNMRLDVAAPVSSIPSIGGRFLGSLDKWQIDALDVAAKRV